MSSSPLHAHAEKVLAAHNRVENTRAVIGELQQPLFGFGLLALQRGVAAIHANRLRREYDQFQSAPEMDGPLDMRSLAQQIVAEAMTAASEGDLHVHEQPEPY